MASLLRVVGFAIVSADGMIADAAGRMPPEILHEADQRFFARGLEEADVVVHGRNSQEDDRHAQRRRRVVVTRQVAALAPHPENPKAILWNPNGATLDQACEALGVSQGAVAVIGGPEVYALLLPRYDEFHLSRAEHARIPGGRAVFPGIPPLTPEDVLRRHGMEPGPTQILDAAAGISVATWRR